MTRSQLEFEAREQNFPISAVNQALGWPAWVSVCLCEMANVQLQWGGFLNRHWQYKNNQPE